MRKKLYFGSNLKMYKTIAQTTDFLKDLQKRTSDISREEMELFIIPSYTSLPAAVQSVDQNLIRIGAQNMHWEEEGQFTGEISPLMLKELGIGIVMAGHSERRHVFGETDREENRKVLSALRHGFTALLCVGETGEEKEYGISAEVLRSQLKIGFHGVSEEAAGQILVAYEPVWSIGVSGTPATADYAEKMHAEIKDCLREIFGGSADRIPVLYGGSVNPENCTSMIVQPDVDGLYVGRAAWHADAFDSLIRMSMEAYHRTGK